MEDKKFQNSTNLNVWWNAIYSSMKAFNNIELGWFSESEEIIINKVH